MARAPPSRGPCGERAARPSARSNPAKVPGRPPQIPTPPRERVRAGLEFERQWVWVWGAFSLVGGARFHGRSGRRGPQRDPEQADQEQDERGAEPPNNGPARRGGGGEKGRGPSPRPPAGRRDR